MSSVAERRPGVVKGPIPRPLIDRVMEKVDKDGPGGCWLWLGYVMPNGYGKLTNTEGTNLVHRIMYQHERGPVDAALDLDHLCRVRSCCNPDHLEPVTRRTNLLRGDTVPARNAAATQCPQGHAYDLINTRWDGRNRHCRTCDRARWDASAERRRAG